MDGILLINTINGSLILRSRFTNSSNYPLAITDALIHILQSSSNNQNIPAIIHLPSISTLTFLNQKTQNSSSDSDSDSNSDSDSDLIQSNHPHQLQYPFNDHHLHHGSVCCNLIKHHLWLACIASSDIEPSIVFEYLNRFLNFLSNYLNQLHPINPPQIHPSLIEANFDLVHQLIHLTAPTYENPYGKNWSEPGLIQELIPIKTKSLVKFISEATETLSKAGKNQYRLKPTIFSSAIPWRPTGLEYPKQEIWLDLLESISAILDRDGLILRFEVVGMVDIQSRLSGLPDISLKFIDPTKIGRVGFHSCVRYNKWEKEKIVSFVPPDGRFRLMSYRSTPVQSSTSLPVIIKPTVTVGEHGGSFKLLINTLGSLSKLVIRWQLGRLATGIISEQLHCRSRDGRRIDPAWEWDESRKEIRWSFDGQDANCCLTGLWTHRSRENEPSHSLEIEFESRIESPNLSFQGLKVDKIDIKSNPSFIDHHHHSGTGLSSLAASFGSPAINKGVKMKFRSAQYEIRW